MTAAEDSGRPEPTDPLEELAATIRGSGLVPPGSAGIALLSGGPDSACLVAGLARALGPGRVTALHVDYRLRPESGEDRAAAARLCADLGLELVVAEPGPSEGNVQGWAREARYDAAERLRAERGADWIAAGHTLTDRAETLLYRLAASPGSRGLLGMPARRGRLVRPLLALSREQLRRIALAARLPFVDDRSNEDPAFARARIRAEVLPALRAVNPAAERNVELTRAELEEDEELLSALAAEALAGAEGGGIEGAALRELAPALRRRALRLLAERALGRPVAVPRELAASVLRLALDPEGGRVDAGGGASFLIESGRVTVEPGGDAEGDPGVEPCRLPLPGRARSGEWELEATPLELPFRPAGPEVATLDLEALRAAGGAELTVRRWRPGDRIRPLGMSGRRRLQDVLTDAGVPRGRRRRLPVVLAGDEIAWIPGVAVAERFRLRPETAAAIRLTARPDLAPDGPPPGRSA